MTRVSKSVRTSASAFRRLRANAWRGNCRAAIPRCRASPRSWLTRRLAARHLRAIRRCRNRRWLPVARPWLEVAAPVAEWDLGQSAERSCGRLVRRSVGLRTDFPRWLACRRPGPFRHPHRWAAGRAGDQGPTTGSAAMTCVHSFTGSQADELLVDGAAVSDNLWVQHRPPMSRFHRRFWVG